jgi:hypothetical protein
MDLGTRIALVAQKRFGGKPSLWAVKAGLSRSMLSTFQHRWKAFQEGRGSEPTLKRPALEALAKAAGVSFGWLATGDSVMDSRYPSLEATIAAFPGRWEPGAVAQARSMDFGADGDPGEAWWLWVLDAADTGLRVALAKLPDRRI